ncbi:hypothetical protein F4776DRAFT_524372, partial [Hypoxylon sp. NC0597]
LCSLIGPLLSLSPNLSSKGIVCCKAKNNSARAVPFRSPFGNFIANNFVRLDPDEVETKYGSLQTLMAAQVDLEERIPLLIGVISCSQISVSPYTFDRDIGPNPEMDDTPDDFYKYIILDVQVMLLVAVLHERARKRNILQEPSVCAANQTFDINFRERYSSSNPMARVAVLVYIEKARYGDKWIKFAVKQDTRQLLNLLIKVLWGDESEDLARRVREQMMNIFDDIVGGSTAYEEIHTTISDFLAEQQCGYCFMDRYGEPKRERNNDEDDEDDDDDDDDSKDGRDSWN